MINPPVEIRDCPQKVALGSALASESGFSKTETYGPEVWSFTIDPLILRWVFGRMNP
jgi:hypothetical protein